MVKRQGSTMADFALDIVQVKGWQLAPIYQLFVLSNAVLFVYNALPQLARRPTKSDTRELEIFSRIRHGASSIFTDTPNVTPIRGKYWYWDERILPAIDGGKAYARFDESR
jgi:hypothetical protein